MKTKAEIRADVRKFQRWRKKVLAEQGPDTYVAMTRQPERFVERPATETDIFTRANRLDSQRFRDAPSCRKEKPTAYR